MSEHNLDLPWRADDPYPDVILSSNNEEVASCMNNDDCSFIVKAVNSHAALVKALQEIADTDQYADSEDTASELREIARSAIALVGTGKVT